MSVLMLILLFHFIFHQRVCIKIVGSNWTGNAGVSPLIMICPTVANSFRGPTLLGVSAASEGIDIKAIR
jgi:hypothetical protein